MSLEWSHTKQDVNPELIHCLTHAKQLRSGRWWRKCRRCWIASFIIGSPTWVPNPHRECTNARSGWDFFCFTILYTLSSSASKLPAKQSSLCNSPPGEIHTSQFRAGWSSWRYFWNREDTFITAVRDRDLREIRHGRFSVLTWQATTAPNRMAEGVQRDGFSFFCWNFFMDWQRKIKSLSRFLTGFKDLMICVVGRMVGSFLNTNVMNLFTFNFKR